MPKINLLDSSIYNRIAAGEVVQQPSSVVKELIENCIDAGANEITVEIKEGGIKEISVKDNGCGISSDDLKRAFLPHATSKVKVIEDLDSVSTLGFRGEALSSIASVSHVFAKSRTISDDIGSKIEVRGGDFSDIEPTSCPVGTEIIVRNIFFNTPARAKFLRKPFQEEADVTSVMQKTAFSNPNVSICYVIDDKISFRTTGEGLLSAISSVYGIEYANSCIEVDYKKNNVSIKGYICKPSLTKPNRNYQTIIVNGRYIKDISYSSSVANAFGDRLMKRTFPVFVLDTIVPFDEVDVNVHPAKTEVRFKRPHEIYGIAYNAVKSSLLSLENAENLGLNGLFDEKKPEIIEKSTPGITAESYTVDISSHNIAKQNSDKNSGLLKTFLGDSSNKKSDKLSSSSEINYKLIERLMQRDSENKDSNDQKIKQIDQIDQNDYNLISDTNDNYQIIGQVFECYLLVRIKNDLLFIDQHAAHERLLFDELTKKADSSEIALQPLLLPYVRTFSSTDYQRISDITSELVSLGFEIDEFGKNTIKVSCVPMILSELNFEEFFDSFLSEYNNRQDFSYSELLKDKLAMRACRSAIKAGDSLSDTQIKSILKQISETNMTLQCPHGRPICIKFSKKDLEKMFKRIV